MELILVVQICKVPLLHMLQDLRSLGLRKFFLAAIGLLGCIPHQISKGMIPQRQCDSYIDNIVVLFNNLLRSLVDQLNTEYPDSILYMMILVTFSMS
jgi:hypothetical protein